MITVRIDCANKHCIFKIVVQTGNGIRGRTVWNIESMGIRIVCRRNVYFYIVEVTV